MTISSSDPHVRDFLCTTALKFPPHWNFGKVRGLVCCGSVNNTFRMRVYTRSGMAIARHQNHMAFNFWRQPGNMMHLCTSKQSLFSITRSVRKSHPWLFTCACTKEMTTSLITWPLWCKAALKTPSFNRYFDVSPLHVHGELKSATASVRYDGFESTRVNILECVFFPTRRKNLFLAKWKADEHRNHRLTLSCVTDISISA